MHRRLLSVVVLLLLPGVAAADSHPFDVHDLLAMQRVSAMAVSPDASRVVYTLRTTDLEADRGRTDLWMVDVESGRTRQLTSHPASDGSATFARDGKSLYFLSSRSGTSQVWWLSLEGGEALPVTDLPLDVGTFRISRDGTRIAVSLEVFVDAATLEETVDRLGAGSEDAGIVYDSIFVRHWDQWKDGRRRHLFVAPLRGREVVGDFVDIMPGMDADCPNQPFGGRSDYTFTPEGDRLVFSAREVGASEAWSTDFDLYLGWSDGEKAPQCLTSENEAWDAHPVFSPDGSRLAYLAMREPGYEADRYRVVLRSWSGVDHEFGEAEWVTEEWDRSPSSLSWAPDGGSLLAHASNLGRRSLFRIDLAKGGATELVAGGSVAAEAEVGDKLFYAVSGFGGPTELYHARRDGSRAERLTHVNDARVAEAEMGTSEQFHFVGANGDTVYGWLVRPVPFDPAHKAPVAFLIHGGPQGSFGTNFHYRWNPQVYAGRGYAVVMIDFHGSSGYGEDFQNAIQKNWGGWPLEDLQKGLAYVLEQNPWMDGDRVAALGASYGGYMINWIAGNWPDRFTCLVNHDGLFDTRAGYYATEELWFPERDFGGTPWARPEFYEKWNPANFVGNWRTPMLVVHGGRDYRVPLFHGLAAFNALQRRGIESRLLYFPKENHWVLRPQNSIQWHEEVLDWLDRFNQGEAQPASTR